VGCSEEAPLNVGLQHVFGTKYYNDDESRGSVLRRRLPARECECIPRAFDLRNHIICYAPVVVGLLNDSTASFVVANISNSVRRLVVRNTAFA
jgi:hypothetical protein